MQAIIVAGGKGSRMAPYTNDRPKSMVGVLDKPLILYQVERLRDAGVKKIVIEGNTTNHASVLQRFLGDGSKFGVDIVHRAHDRILGTGGGLRDGLLTLAGESNAPTIVTYGDTFSDIKLKKLYKQHVENSNPITAVTVPQELPYGVFSRTEGGLSFVEKPTLDSNASMFVVDNSIVEQLPEVGDFTEFLARGLREDQISVGLYEHKGFRVNVNSLLDLGLVEEWLLKKRGVEPYTDEELYYRPANYSSRK